MIDEFKMSLFELVVISFILISQSNVRYSTS